MDATEKSPSRLRRRMYLMRHGEVSYFDGEGKPLRPSDVPLNSEGLKQVRRAAEEFSAVPLDRVMASDLPRSVETAQWVTQGKNLTIETHEDLREIQPGRLADIPANAAEKVFLGAFSEDVHAATQFLGGETFGSLQRRVTRWLTFVLEDSGWQDLLVVAHGGVNRAILSHAMGIGLKNFGSLEQDPACINVVDVDNQGRMLVRLVNHTPYNPLKVGLDLTTMEGIYLQYKGQTGKKK